jgi:hypothetical protein
MAPSLTDCSAALQQPRGFEAKDDVGTGAHMAPSPPTLYAELARRATRPRRLKTRRWPD